MKRTVYGALALALLFVSSSLLTAATSVQDLRIGGYTLVGKNGQDIDEGSELRRRPADLRGPAVGELRRISEVVVETADASMANAGADQTAIVGDTVTLDGNGSQDADGDNLSFAWSLITKPANSTVALTGADTATPTSIPDQPGLYIAQLIVNDGHVDSDPDTVSVTITALQPVNQPPVITSTPVTTATVGQLYSYDVDASDLDVGDILAYALTTAPAGMAINGTSGLIEWTPTAAQVRNQSVTVQVADTGNLSASQTFTINVQPATVTVPDVVGAMRAAAGAAITSAGLLVGAVTEENSAGVPAGNVISQDPTAGTPASPGTAVNLVVSLGPTGSGGGPAQTLEEKWVALDAVKAKFDSLPGLGRDADNQEMLNLLRSRPEFVDAGIDVASSSVWATFADGDPIVIFNNRTLPNQPVIALQPRSAEPPTNTAASAGAESAQPTSRPRDARLAASFPELPFSSAVRVLDTFGPFVGAAHIDLRRILTRQNYVPVAEEDATLEALKTVGGDGVFYFSTHGGFWRLLGLRTFGLLTATRADLGIDRALTDDILHQRIVRALAKVEFDVVTGTWRSGWRYAITAAWVRNYWSNFSANSFVYIDACNSDEPDQTAQDFKTAVLAKNVSVYAGWTGPVDDRIAADTARLVFQRLLGDDASHPNPPFSPEMDFKQRPFDYISVLNNDLPEHNLGRDGTSRLSFTAPGEFGLLAPSILLTSLVEVDLPGVPQPGGTLTILGAFGTDPRPDPDSKVTVGGLDCPVRDWQPHVIICQLPGLESAGDVVVTVRKHESNKARITEWKGQFRFLVEGEGTLRAAIKYNVHFRADFRKVRNQIHFPPIGPFFLSRMLTVDSTASYVCSGTATAPDPTVGTLTTTWSGSGIVPASRGIPESPGSYQMALTDVTSAVRVQVNHGKGPGCDSVLVHTFPDGTETATGRHKLSVDPFDIGPINPNGPTFPAGFRNLPSNCMGLPSVIRCAIEWDTIAVTPGTEPDPDSAR